MGENALGWANANESIAGGTDALKQGRYKCTVGFGRRVGQFGKHTDATYVGCGAGNVIETNGASFANIDLDDAAVFDGVCLTIPGHGFTVGDTINLFFNGGIGDTGTDTYVVQDANTVCWMTHAATGTAISNNFSSGTYTVSLVTTDFTNVSAFGHDSVNDQDNQVSLGDSNVEQLWANKYRWNTDQTGFNVGDVMTWNGTEWEAQTTTPPATGTVQGIFDNDAAAAAASPPVSIGETYELSATNTYGLPEGILKVRRN